MEITVISKQDYVKCIFSKYLLLRIYTSNDWDVIGTWMNIYR